MAERRAIQVGGIVQGVGFRPYVHGLASRLQLHGFVKNQTGDVLIEVEGEVNSLERFLDELACRPPPLAQIDQVRWVSVVPRGDQQFRIEPSEVDAASQFFIAPDVATCAACVRELLDPADRRFRYPFLNCTNCGPRLTIITGSPYDRPRTTMARFAMCPDCRDEYEDPANRRFHAQPTACAACGPRLQVLGADGAPAEAADPLACFVQAIAAGRIGAMKGLGGYHLVCDARNAASVAELRRRKHRDEKPFALMVRDLDAAQAICELGPLERQLLQPPRCPIVLLRKRAGSGIAEPVAPGNPYLGVMLPYTPLHHLLLHDLAGLPLVMTSGNRADEPIAHQEEDAVQRLRGIADLFLVHNRPIHVRCDDSVTRVVAGQEQPIRRSRGYAPQPVRLPVACAVPILAVGGQLKGVFALGRGRHAILSHHLGDLDHYAAYRAFERDIDLYQQVFAIRPELIVHDLHPDYASTRYAVQRARQSGLATLAVQHHYAHFASCLAEHGLTEPAIGVTFDGTGYGTDGAVWGGEFLVGDYRHWQRAAHLRYVGLPGGEQAIREPWRMAVSHLVDAGCGLEPVKSRVPVVALRAVQRMLHRRLNTPWTSSAGRLFDAVAALLGLRQRVSYEGQAAVELEWLATEAPSAGSYPFTLVPQADAEGPAKAEPPRLSPVGGDCPQDTALSPVLRGETRNEGSNSEDQNYLPAAPALIVDTRPMMQAICEELRHGTEPRRIARRFHATVVELIAAVCARIRDQTGCPTVVLSGGVFLNSLLTTEVTARLAAQEFSVLRHHLVPPNDAGLSLGQIAIAAARGGGVGREN